MYPETIAPEGGQHHIFKYEEASSEQRFLNFAIDNLLMIYGMAAFTSFLLAKLLGHLSPGLAKGFFSEDNKTNYLFALYLITFFNYLVYYTFCERIFSGITLGKWITGTKAVREDGKVLTLKDAFLRSLARVIPFESFSAFGGLPWHDAWTKTVVVKTR
jgi:uncharacterized RDD family membrane protein YckC